MNADDYFRNLECFQDVASKLRSIVLSTGLTETVKYHLPFYVGRKDIAYINVTKKGVVLGLVYGAALSDPLFNEVKMQVAKCLFVNDVDEVGVRRVLHKAMEFDSFSEENK